MRFERADGDAGRQKNKRGLVWRNRLSFDSEESRKCDEAIASDRMFHSVMVSGRGQESTGWKEAVLDAGRAQSRV